MAFPVTIQVYSAENRQYRLNATVSDPAFAKALSESREVAIAHRAFGASDADSAEVRFELYALRTNEDRTAGAPTYYFQHVRSMRSRQRYCDVNDAFARELAMGNEGLR